MRSEIEIKERKRVVEKSLKEAKETDNFDQVFNFNLELNTLDWVLDKTINNG